MAVNGQLKIQPEIFSFGVSCTKSFQKQIDCNSKKHHNQTGVLPLHFFSSPYVPAEDIDLSLFRLMEEAAKSLGGFSTYGCPSN